MHDALEALVRWQARYLAEYGDRPKHALFASPRLGKTYVGVALAVSWGVPTVVLCPLSVATTWEALCIEKGLTVVNAAPLSSDRAAQALQSDAAVVILNDDKIARVEPAVYARVHAAGALIVDESHRFASYRSARGKSMRKIARAARFVRLLTGTPVGSHAGNLWGQMTAIAPERWGHAYTRFAQQWLICDPIFPSIVHGVRDPNGLRALLMRDAAIVRREDIFGPDTWQDTVRAIALPQHALDLYDRMAAEWVLDDPVVTAETLPTVLLRLGQIASGFIGSTRVHTAKIDAVMSDLNEILESNERAVVFYRFTAEGDELERRACEAFGGKRVGRLYGKTSPEDRDAVKYNVEHAKNGYVAIVQTRAGGVGISFCKARYALFLSEDFSFVDQHQARDRTFEPGEPRVVTHYRATGTIDEYIAQVQVGKATLHDDVRHGDLREITFGSRYRTKARKLLTRT